jgi:hypothetical protein
MIALKDYQHRVLDSLREFFRLCSKTGNPAYAFSDVCKQNGSGGGPYLPIHAAGLVHDMPYVCLRVPTGGGKTLLACHTAGLAMSELLHADRAVVLWLVPSNTILDQTADALRDARHPYRRALEMACGAIEVVTIEEALNLPRASVDGQTVVIVSTIQAFRVEDSTGRKVYSQNGVFQEHLLNAPASREADLLKGPDGKPVPSLVNMLRLRRPVVIVDEAHNARTDLSFAALGDVMPSCIVEFTATPAGDLTEEFQCAQFLDSTLPGVRFWVRNLSKRSTSFRLQTSTDWFYPDFVCQLEDGRILVIEYKGGHLLDAADAKEKRDIGNLWAARSNGRCLFAMPSNNRFDEILNTLRT